jgi:hypothetical protein
MGLSVGIPSRGITPSLIRVLKYISEIDFDGEILVGINPDGVVRPKLDIHSIRDPRIKIYFHKSDLGLYGNFRFLLKQASFESFVWQCTDDQLTAELSRVSTLRQEFDYDLLIPSWRWAEYSPESLSFELNSSIPGNYPSFENGMANTITLMHCEPSWIFGIWKTDFLRGIFPSRNFDWLDTHILQQVLIKNRVAVFESQSFTIIGTWHWANKLPTCVNGRYHNPAEAILRQILLVVPIIRCNQGDEILSIYRRCKSLIIQSINMNRERRHYS